MRSRISDLSDPVRSSNQNIMKKMKPHGVAALLCLALTCLSHPADAQLFKRLKSEVVGVANQKADQKAVGTTGQAIDEADTLLHRGIRSLFAPKKKKEKDAPSGDPNAPQGATPTVAPAPDSTRHRP